MYSIKDINELFGIKESFELPEKLLKTLMDKETKDKLCHDFLQRDFDLSHDVLRDYFQEEHSNRGSLKQDYTPDCICDLLFRLAPKANSMLDVCSGTGSLTISFLNQKNEHTYYQLEELSQRSIPILLLNLILRNVNATCVQSDVLKNEIQHVYKITKGDQFSDIIEVEEIQEPTFDLIVSNPPYSMAWTPIQDYRFSDYDLAPKSKADYAFVLDILSRLSNNGKAFIILPHGVLFRSAAEGKIRQKLIENNVIETIIGLPDKLFLNTQIPVCIMVLNKNKRDSSILFIDSSKNFVKQSAQNNLSEEHISKIVSAYNDRKDIDKYCHLATFDEIKKNDFNLNIPRYVDTFEDKEPTRTVAEIMNEIIELEKEYNKNLIEISKMVDELTGTTLESQKQVDDLKLKYKVLENFTNESAWQNFTKTMNTIDEQVAKAQKTTVELQELASIERAVKGKIYKRGCILLQISATDGQLLYLNKDTEVEAKYAVIIPNPDINSKYLYYSVTSNLEQYLRKVQQDINIRFEDVLKIPVVYYIDDLVQKQIVAIMETLNSLIGNMELNKKCTKEEKKFLLENMFV